MGEFDLAGWVSRAQAFAIEIGRVPGAVVRAAIVAVPIAESEMQAIERALAGTVPTSLRRGCETC
jgi:DNA-binding transcriptional regulator YdaS (Cro superfamily)